MRRPLLQALPPGAPCQVLFSASLAVHPYREQLIDKLKKRWEVRFL